MQVIGGTVALFEDLEVGASVLPMIQGKTGEEVGLDPVGRLCLSLEEAKRVTGFQLIFRIPKKAPMVVLQRNLNKVRPDDKAYTSSSLVTLREELRGDEWDTLVMLDHIQVSRENGTSWTRWRGEVPNRVDFWGLQRNQARLFQVGVVARGDGDGFHFRVLGELRGEWSLYKTVKGIVGIPTNPVWGEFDVRRTILGNKEFQDLLARTSLPTLEGAIPTIAPLDPLAEPKTAAMQWWSSFAGMRGQGPATLGDGRSLWVCGEDFLGEPDPDGIVRLHRGTVVSYNDIHTERQGANSLTKLLGVRLVG